jgi:hypothetical protein
MSTLMTDLDRNALADNEAGRISFLSLHTATPGITGAAEATLGSPAYARKAPTFNAAGAIGPLGGTLQPATVGVAWSSEVIFDVAAGSYTHWGSWSLLTAGVFRIGNVLAATQSPGSQGQVKLSISVGPVAGA